MRPVMTREKEEAAGIRYLLGLLSEEEHARVERALLEDDEAFEAMSALEDELFHEYAQGGLDAAERRRFEGRYLASDEGRRRLADARALLAKVNPHAPRRAAGLGASWLLPAAAVLALAAGGAWLAARRDLGTETPSASSSGVQKLTRVALALAPGVGRDVSSAPRRALLGADEVLVLTLSLPATGVPPRLQARVLSAEGRQVWHAFGLAAQEAPAGPVVVLEVTPGALPEGDYQLLLAADTAAADEVADYAFTVLRR
jgi:hypothetical protein